MSEFLIWTCLCFIMGFGVAAQFQMNKEMKAQEEMERLEDDRIRRFNSGVEAAKELWK